MRPIAAALLLCACGACATGQLFPSAATPTKTAEELFNERWAGKTEDDLLVHYGKPTEVLPLSTGNYVNSYHSELAVSTASSRASFAGSYGGQRSDATSTTIYCDRRFEMDKATHTVVRAVIVGSSCDYSR